MRIRITWIRYTIVLIHIFIHSKTNPKKSVSILLRPYHSFLAEIEVEVEAEVEVVEVVTAVAAAEAAAEAAAAQPWRRRRRWRR